MKETIKTNTETTKGKPSELVGNKYRNEMLEERFRRKSYERVLDMILNHLSFDADGVGTVKGLSSEETAFINALYNRGDNLPLFPKLVKEVHSMSTEDLKSLRRIINEIINKRSQ